MSQKTFIPYGDTQAVKIQSAGLFAACMQRLTTLNRLVGKLPQQAQAESRLKNQTSNEMPIVRCMDLTKKAGDEVDYDLIQPVSGYPIMGSEMAEGKGVKMTLDKDSLRINQVRFPISAGDTMTQQRTPHQLRGLARSAGRGIMERYEDQSTLIHLAGARGFHNNTEWAIPLASHPDFAKICINTVKAPTKNRHFISTGSGIEPVAASGNEISIETTDVMNIDLVDSLRTLLDGMALAPPPVKFNGDQMATDSPMRVLLVSPEQYNSLIRSTNFRNWQANAMARAQQAKNNPLFMGEAGLWNGILIVKMPKPIRFYKGDAINWCASSTTETETSTDLVPDSFGTSHAVDRALLLGGQALVEAFGKAKSSGAPYFWSEKELDHGDKLEVLIGAIAGKSKVRFSIDHGDEIQPTDFGVIAIDTAVTLAGV
jgi:N4-gp56 family major capsid protein